MKKTLLLLILPVLLSLWSVAQYNERHLIINTTGNGFSSSSFNGIDPGKWEYIQKFANLTYNGQDASVSAIRFYVTWNEYEPTPGNFTAGRIKIVQAIQAMLALKSGMKIALHFPYQRPGPQPGQSTDGYFDNSDIAKTIAGEYVRETISYSNPSIYSPTGKQRFYAFVDDVLDQLAANNLLGNILYCEMGNGSAEEFAIPYLFNGAEGQGLYDDHSLNAWRTEYLPCRYPNQSNVTWDGNTFSIASAPPASNPNMDWNSEHRREYHRFASWGLMKFYKGFRDIVKDHGSSLKVVYFISDYGGSQANLRFMHGASIPMGLQEFDGIYTSDGGQYDNWSKIRAIDAIKGSNANKIAAIEFDQDDLGQQANPAPNSPIDVGMANEWIPRAFKHGANNVHLAMFFNDVQIDQLKPVLASVRATYLNPSYTPPSRQSPITQNLYPDVFTGGAIAQSWNTNNGDNWSVTDNNPVSVNVIDDGYWQNIWSCSSAPNPCDFTPNVSTSNANPQPNASITLTASASGQNSGITYTWSQNGLSGTGTTKTFNAPATAGTYTYMVTASKTNCSNKTATVQITVPTQGGGGSGCNINKVRLQFRAPSDCCYERLVGAKIQGSNNGGSSWTDLYTFTGNGNGNFQDFTFSNTTSYSSARFVASSIGWGELRELEFYDGSTKLTGTTFGTDNYANAFDGSTATEWHAPSTPGSNNYAGMNFTGCSAPIGCDFNVTASASPSSVTVSGSSSLSYVCSGADCGTASFAWSGQSISGNQNPKTITAPASAGSYQYSITATKTGCTTKTANAILTVTSGSGTGCTVNKVKLKFRQSGECCMDRLPGAKIQGSNDGTNWTDLYTFTTEGTGSMEEYGFSNSNAYSSVRFQASSSGWGELYELEFYKGTAKLTGTPFGVGNYANAFDGNLSTDWQVSSNPGTNNHAGLNNLGNCSGSPLMLDLTNPDQLNNKLSLVVSPNPSNGILNAGFYLPRGEKATIVINDLQGRTIYRQTITGNGQHNEKIYLNNKSSGMFLMRLHTLSGVEVRKINIAR